jgi:hypothetical protein
LLQARTSRNPGFTSTRRRECLTADESGICHPTEGLQDSPVVGPVEIGDQIRTAGGRVGTEGRAGKMNSYAPVPPSSVPLPAAP